MPHVKNQHFVPRFLLNYFTDSSNNIWCYDKQWKRTQKKGIGGVAFEEYFYDITHGEKKGSLEYVYQKAETHVAPIIQKVVIERALTNISLDEKVALALFIIMQLNRTKTALERTKDLHNQFWGSIIEFAKATGAKLDSEPSDPKNVWLSDLNNTPEYAITLLRKRWFLASSNKEFYTSDHPVVKSNYKNRAISQIRGVLGLDSDGIEIYFPLTPSLLICILCEKSYSQPNEDLIQYQPQNIEYVNHLQVKQSDKFVFAASNNFQLVEDMMRNKEV